MCSEEFLEGGKNAFIRYKRWIFSVPLTMSKILCIFHENFLYGYLGVEDTVDQEIFAGNIFRRLNFRVVLFSSL